MSTPSRISYLKTPRSVLLLNDASDKRVIGEVQRLRAWFEQRAIQVKLWEDSSPQEMGSTDYDLVIVLGGDGTFLHAVHHLQACPVPIIGIRFCTFGYLAELEPGNWEPELERVLQGEARIETWMQLKCDIRNGAGESIKVSHAVNEAVITAAQVARMLEVDLRIDGEDITCYRGDGIIVATPVGSTAHSRAAGGPIVEPTDRCFVLTPLASQSMTYRPLILHATRKIEIVVLKARHGTAITLDGLESQVLESGSVVQLSASEREVRVARIVERSRLRTIRERLQWGVPLIHRSRAQNR